MLDTLLAPVARPGLYTASALLPTLNAFMRHRRSSQRYLSRQPTCNGKPPTWDLDGCTKGGVLDCYYDMEDGRGNADNEDTSSTLNSYSTARGD